jgi:hypothetical protein
MTEGAIAVLEADVGVWDGDLVVRMGGVESRNHGTMRTHLLGGKWLIADWSTDSGDFVGHGVYGWDPAKQKYVGTWVDSMRTFLVTGEGTWDADARTMTFIYTFELPGRGPITQREVTEKPSPDHHIFHSFISMNGAPETEFMTVHYTRRRD